jgi:molybdate transport system regulatory protein
MSTPVIRFQIDFSATCAVAPAKIDLLEAIRNSGSLSRGARNLGMSYRRARMLIDSFKGAFREPVTRAIRGGPGGGGVLLTKFGAELVDRYRDQEREFGTLATQRLQMFTSSVASQRRPKSPSVSRTCHGRISREVSPIHARQVRGLVWGTIHFNRTACGTLGTVHNTPLLPILAISFDKSDTYRCGYKSGTAGATHNIVGIASSKERCCRRPATQLRYATKSFRLLVMTEELDVLGIISERLRGVLRQAAHDARSRLCRGTDGTAGRRSCERIFYGSNSGAIDSLTGTPSGESHDRPPSTHARLIDVDYVAVTVKRARTSTRGVWQARPGHGKSGADCGAAEN